jgi:hypothetical protein
VSTHVFRTSVLLLFVGGLVAFFLIIQGRWLTSRVTEPLIVRLKAIPELQAWLEDARTRFLANSPRIAGRPLSFIIDYEEDAAASAEPPVGRGLVAEGHAASSALRRWPHRPGAHELRPLSRPANWRVR